MTSSEKKKNLNLEEEGMDGRNVALGDGPFHALLADWLIGDPLATLTD